MRLRAKTRNGVTLLAVFLILSLAVQSAHASTYVGYNASNLGASTCGTNCAGPAGTSDPNPNQQGEGESFAQPFAGSASLVSVGLYTGNQVPTSIVILTFGGAGTPTSTDYACDGGTCSTVNGGQSFTIVDVETVTGLLTSSFNTINLASPPIVNPGAWVAVDFMQNPATGSPYMFLGANPSNAIKDACFHFGVVTPVIGNSVSSSTSNVFPCLIGSFIIGASFQAVTTAGTTLTQCIGNGGSTCPTIAKTNSTHSINFNQSLTLVYVDQSGINGQWLNTSVWVGKSYTNGMILTLSAYTSSCAVGLTPFSPQCQGQRVATVSTVNPSKGQNSLIVNTPVSNGQFLALAVSGSLSGLDLNDTNTGFTSPITGSVYYTTTTSPQLLTATPCVSGFVPCGGLSSSAKMGLWGFLNGQVFIIPPVSSAGCNVVNDFACTLVFISSATSRSNPVVGGFLWLVIFFAATYFFVEYIIGGMFNAPSLPGAVWLLILLVEFFMFTVAGVFPVVYFVMTILIVSFLFATNIGGLLRSGSGRFS